MTAPLDNDPSLAGYAHPEKLVTTQWVADHADHPNVVIAESDEDVLLYHTGHIPGAVKLDWHTDLNDEVAGGLGGALPRAQRAHHRAHQPVDVSDGRDDHGEVATIVPDHVALPCHVPSG